MQERSIFDKMGLKPETKRAYMPTMCNHNPCGIETRGKKVGDDSNYYQIGVEIRIRGDGNYVFDTWTVYEGVHVGNSHAVIDFYGKLLEKELSKVNCFGLGWMKADQGYIDQLIEELEGMVKNVRRKWEEVE